MAEELVKRTKILSWMLKRLKIREFDSNKSAVGETLAVLLQSSQANVEKLAAMNGIDILLQVDILHLMNIFTHSWTLQKFLTNSMLACLPVPHSCLEVHFVMHAWQF